VSQAGVVQISFFRGDLSSKCFKRRLLKNWPKQTVTRDIAAPNSCWMMLFSFGLVTEYCIH